MRRIHIHIHVDDLSAAKRFYRALFGAAPSLEKPDYAKWSLDDPAVNFAISSREAAGRGISHLGIQVDDRLELDKLSAHLDAADYHSVAEPDARCCYARSDKHWATDPAGVTWELFHTVAQG